PGAEIAKDTHRQEADIHVGQSDPEEARPGPLHVAGVQYRDSLPDSVSQRARPIAREAVEPASHEMPPRVAPECVTGEERRVDEEDHAPHADAEPAVAEEGPERVVVKNEDEGDGEVERVAMKVLDDQETGLAAVPSPRERADRAARRRAEERAVVGLAIVIAGRAERAREHENQEGGRRRQERGPPPRWPRPEPGLLQRSGSRSVRIDEQEGRIERRQVRPV